MVNKLNFEKDERGFVLSGLALLLILPAMLIGSTYLSIVQTGGETTSIQSLSDKVFYTGLRTKRTVKQMNTYGMDIDSSSLNYLEDRYELASGLDIELHRIDNTVSINVRDYGGTAKYTANYELS